MKPQEAIYQACLLRFRPIMMTTMCALLSGLPLMLGHGAGSELRRPLGYAMVGGLILSQALTLFTTPVVYLYLDRAHYWYESRKKARQTRKAAAESAESADSARSAAGAEPAPLLLPGPSRSRREAAHRRRRAQDGRIPAKGPGRAGLHGRHGSQRHRRPASRPDPRLRRDRARRHAARHRRLRPGPRVAPRQADAGDHADRARQRRRPRARLARRRRRLSRQALFLPRAAGPAARAGAARPQPGALPSCASPTCRSTCWGARCGAAACGSTSPPRSSHCSPCWRAGKATSCRRRPSPSWSGHELRQQHQRGRGRDQAAARQDRRPYVPKLLHTNRGMGYVLELRSDAGEP